MSRVTRKAISAAIKAATGHEVGVYGSPQIGCYHFYSNDPATASLIASAYSSTVYVCYLSQLTLQQWVDEWMEIADA